MIKVDEKLLNVNQTANKGYLVIQPEMYGFEDEVDIIVQKPGQLQDYDPFQVKALPMVIRANFSQKIFIPAEYDTYISFSPIKQSK